MRAANRHTRSSFRRRRNPGSLWRLPGFRRCDDKLKLIAAWRTGILIFHVRFHSFIVLALALTLPKERDSRDRAENSKKSDISDSEVIS
jgi:hypothetical protein